MAHLIIRNPSNERFVFKIISSSAPGELQLTSDCGVIEPGAAVQLGSKCFHSISFCNFLIISTAFSFLQAWKLGLWCNHRATALWPSTHGLAYASPWQCNHLRSAVGGQCTSLPFTGDRLDNHGSAKHRWLRYLPIKHSNGTVVL